MKHEDSVAAQQMMCGLSDDETLREPPLFGIMQQCYDARYGTNDGGQGVEWGPF